MELTKSGRLQSLLVTDNLLTGEIPSWLWTEMMLGNLRLNKNNWTCPIPDYSKWAGYTDYQSAMESGNCVAGRQDSTQ